MKVVADDNVPYIQGVFEPFGEVLYLPGERITRHDLLDADVLITRSVTKCNEILLRNTPVKLIASATIGHDHIDKNYCSQNGIEWTTAKGCNAGAVGQYVLAALIHAATSAGLDLHDETLAIIGVGDIGSRISEIATSLGMNVLHYDPPREKKEGANGFSSLQEVFEQARIISLHVPLTDGGNCPTRGMVNEEFLRSFDKDIVLINTSRGEVIKTKDLIESIDSGKVSSALIDVWENEPGIDRELLRRCLTATPHIAGYSSEGKARGSAMTVAAVNDRFNLGLSGWAPPMSIDPAAMKMDGKGLDAFEIMQRVFRNVCPLEFDTQKLKNEPASFVQQRRNYPYRNENHQWILDLINCSETLVEGFLRLGFQVNRI